LPLIKEDGYRKWEMQAQELLSHASAQAGDYNAARAAFERLAELADEYDDKDQASRAQVGIGISLMAQENYAEALARFDRNLESANKVGLKPGIIHGFFNRGKALWRLGRYDEAEQMFAQARQSLEDIEKPDAELLAAMRLDNAQMALSRRQLDVAKSEARAALRMSATEFAAIAVEAQSTLCLAQALSREAAASVRECTSSLNAARKLGSIPLISGTLLALASAKLYAHDAAGALSAASEARDIFKRTGQLDSEWRALVVAALAEKELGDSSSATTYAASANTTFAVMEQRLRSYAYKLYLTRDDVQYFQSQLATRQNSSD
jgi:tetratricopeptide (TPR) repeat protein